MTSAERIERFLVGPLSEAGIIEEKEEGALSGPSAVLSAVLSPLLVLSQNSFIRTIASERDQNST